MAKLPKAPNVASIGIGSRRVRPSDLQDDKKIQQINPRSVVVAEVRMVREVHIASESMQHLTLTFREAFGVLGIPILFTLVLCIWWTTCLIYVTLAPNQAANWLMGTALYDNGNFWMIIDTNPVMIKMGAGGLVLADLCYMYVIVKMLRWRTTVNRFQLEDSRPQDVLRVNSATDSWICTASDRFKTQYHDLTSFRGSKRKFWVRSTTFKHDVRTYQLILFLRLQNVCLKLFNLTMQTTVLLDLLKTGSPVILVYVYTGFISMGSLAGAVKILVGRFSAMGEIIAGSV
ncbi:unnamed protein product [Phytophthora fragariaefolia]|uniref:Unnamed protein product n=1 Tax=Phytophthora fragariaefolia TaxID=1490495 RepID=A0A9W6XHC7_9STRA|nr:unnamed protein product [Phytophthora fragariaefolia]